MKNGISVSFAEATIKVIIAIMYIIGMNIKKGIKLLLKPFTFTFITSLFPFCK